LKLPTSAFLTSAPTTRWCATTTICGTDVHILKGEYPVAKC
jgi:hypothetical protein